MNITKEPFVLPDLKGPLKQSNSKAFREKEPTKIVDDIRKYADKMESNASMTSLRTESRNYPEMTSVKTEKSKIGENKGSKTEMGSYSHKYVKK